MKKIMVFVIIFSAGLFFLAGCREEALSKAPVRACTREYRPVCGVDGKTYPNKCTAGDVAVVYEGVCRQKNECTPESKKAQICTMDWTPVCGDNRKTYGNACQACASGRVNQWVPGECLLEESK